MAGKDVDVVVDGAASPTTTTSSVGGGDDVAKPLPPPAASGRLASANGLSRHGSHGSGVGGEPPVVTRMHSRAELLEHRAANAGELEGLYRAIDNRLMPLFIAVMVLNYLDRTNLAFAALTFNRDLGFGPQTYGLGSALFFLPFIFLQVPSNLAMVRVGARRWLAFLMVSWGVVASCFALIRNVGGFFALRVLLGVFEAGAVPAMWYHLSQFYPHERHTKPYTYMTIGVIAANVVGGPIAAGFLSMQGLGGLHGWQWLFMLEGIPSVLLGVLVYAILPDSPYDAHWLTPRQKELLQIDMDESRARSPPPELIPRNPTRLLRLALSNPLLLYVCAVGFMLACTSHTYVFWVPIIIDALLKGTALQAAPAGGAGAAAAAHGAKPGMQRGASWSTLEPVLLSCIPYAVAGVTSLVVAHSSQRRREPYFHTAASVLAGGAMFVAFPAMASISAKAGFANLILVAAFAAAAIGPNTSIVARVSAGPAQLLAMPLWNSVATLGGFAGPFVTGALRQSTGGFGTVSYILGAMLMLSGLLIILLRFLANARERRLAAEGDAVWADSEHSPGQMQGGAAASGASNGGGLAAGLRKASGVPPAPAPEAAAAGAASGRAAAGASGAGGLHARGPQQPQHQAGGDAAV